MDDLQRHLAQTLKEQRARRGWSLSQTAEITGVSKAMLGQIERAESSPTVATLWKIATGFNLPFSLFIENPAAPSLAPRQPSGLPVFRQANQTMQVKTLFAYDALTRFEMLIVELAPGSRSESAPHEQGVIEHIIVFSGRLSLNVGGHQQSLAVGEALRFQADCPHVYHNPGTETLRFYNLIHYAAG